MESWKRSVAGCLFSIMVRLSTTFASAALLACKEANVGPGWSRRKLQAVVHCGRQFIVFQAVGYICQLQVCFITVFYIVLILLDTLVRNTQWREAVSGNCTASWPGSVINNIAVGFKFVPYAPSSPGWQCCFQLFGIITPCAAVWHHSAGHKYPAVGLLYVWRLWHNNQMPCRVSPVISLQLGQ